MTSRQLRKHRRAEERRQRKIERKSEALAAPTASPVPRAVSPEILEEFGPELIAQANAMRERVHRGALRRSEPTHSPTVPPARFGGPRTPEGKAISSRNSLKHGLASGQILINGEDPAAYQALLAGLLAEHRPATPTEHMLVGEMAQSYWLMQRAIRLQNDCFLAPEVDTARLALFLRYRTTYERAFYKALNTLSKLKKESTKQPEEFVSQNPSSRLPETPKPSLVGQVLDLRGAPGPTSEPRNRPASATEPRS
jgi:hypothetical protein